MKRAGRNEQDMIGLDRAVFGGDRGALDQGQQVALHALAADIAADPLGAGADLVDFVQKDDPVVLDRIDGGAGDFFCIQ